jgi:hypothetical protein
MPTKFTEPKKELYRAFTSFPTVGALPERLTAALTLSLAGRLRAEQ